MEALRRARRPVRREFETLYRELDGLLKEVPLQEESIKAKFKILLQTYGALLEHDQKIVDQLVNEKTTEAEEDREYDEIREFKVRAETLRVMIEKLLPQMGVAEGSVVGHSTTETNKIRNFKLPTIQVRKFSGELRDWLGFWAQFQKIDEDPHMNGSDKFWYLLQYLEPKTDAYEIAAGYPQTNENYVQVIEALKKRYGNEDMQLQVYIRELLNLVISNVNAKEKIPMKTLYLKLDSHIRALKTLNLERADPATWLFPLVESSLPETILYNWQRSDLSSIDGSKEDPPRTRLDLLMSFVEKEVEISQRMDIARNFAEPHRDRRSEQKPHRINDSDRRQMRKQPTSTLASFHVADGKKCVFCERTNHNSEDCFKMRNMSYDDKMKVLREKGLCFRCCGTHLGKECRQRNLECLICRRSHYTVLCRDFKLKKEIVTIPRKRPRTEDTSKVPITPSNANVESPGAVALQTLLVKIESRGKNVIVRAFIDSGSQRSYILQSTANRLSLEPKGIERVVHSLFGGQRTSAVTHNKYSMRVSSINEDFTIMMEVRDHERLCGYIPKVADNYPSILEELKTRKVNLSDVGTTCPKIELIIGADMYARIYTGEMIMLSCGAVAINTKLGWTLMGNVANSNHEGSMANMYLTMSVSEFCISQLWELEALGIKGTEVLNTLESQETEAKDNFVRNITRLPNGRYSIKLPWKEARDRLPSNKVVAHKRLQAASRKLMNENLFEAYDSIFKNWKEEGFIEEVSGDNMGCDCHYLPHRPVIKSSSLTTPVRPVFDASCRVGKNPSLNDCLIKGDNLILQIPNLIQRFREKGVGFVSDIRKAFQMIVVDEKDRDFMRFLWWDGADMERVIEYRHVRVMFGATCSPFILAAVMLHHLKNVKEEDLQVAEKLASTLYVDSNVSSESTIEDYEKFRMRSIKIMKDAGMDLRMWLSNVEDLDDENTRVISVLGLMWDRKDDQLFVNVKGIKIPEKVTKRVILSTVQKVFDPIGFTCPAIIPVKVLLQKTWLNKLKWDEELPEGDVRKFKIWCEQAMKLNEIRIPRLTTNGIYDRDRWSLHIFTDASKEAYAAVVFLRIQTNEITSVQLLSAKSRVAPVKILSIPKLELMGCLIGVRLTLSIKLALEIENVREVYWSDSSTALAWIRRNDQWGTFVANRTKEIRQLTNVEDWRHVQGISNPADLPSRGALPQQLKKSRWWEGPQWLYEDEQFWPVSNTTEDVNEDEVSVERKKSVSTKSVITFSNLNSIRAQHPFAVLIRIIGWVRRFLYNYYAKIKRNGPLTKIELKNAEIMLVKDIQREAFPKEERDNLRGLEIIEDGWGVLRVKTRLTYRNDPIQFKYPVLLPAKSDEVKLLISDYHRAYCHAGVGFLMMKLRQKYWIVKARRVIKAVVSKCMRCRRLSAKQSVPESAPLPFDRVKTCEVFEVVGVDLAGPLVLRNGSKVWMIIFTCAVYRAVHFELTKSCNTMAFISALGCFIKKYRRPEIIYCDNGTNFHGADNFFRKLDWENITRDQDVRRIQFKFNPPSAAWWGGWWERLIRSAKDLIRRTIGKGSLSYVELESVIKNVAEVMNGRPLTYISEDPNDLEPLTPALFLHPLGSIAFPEEDMTEAQRLRFRLTYVNTLKKELRGRFMKEYLAYLVNRKPKKKMTRNLQVGELVLIGNDQQKRIEWPLGRIVELIPGKDGVCRLAKIKTTNGEIVRAVQRLYPLEVDGQDEMGKKVRERGVITRVGRRVKVPIRFQ